MSEDEVLDIIAASIGANCLGGPCGLPEVLARDVLADLAAADYFVRYEPSLRP